jgi:dCMP deaminase
MKEKFIESHMKVAETYAQLSSARRLQVGAIVVKDDRIISIGYNGMPSGWDNDCEYKEYMSGDAGGWLDLEEIYERWPFEEYDATVESNRRYRLVTRDVVLHAESNAIAKLAKSAESGDQSTLFVTHAPCLNCAKLVYQTGINSVFYRNSYRNNEGIEFLEKCGVKVQQC